MLRLAREREELNVVADQRGAPTSAEPIADVSTFALYRVCGKTDLAMSLAGTYHIAASGEAAWHGYAQYAQEQTQARGGAES